MDWISVHSKWLIPWTEFFVPFGNLRLKHSQNIAIFLALPITSCAINHSINAKHMQKSTLCKRTPVLNSTGKVGCAIPKVISSEFRMRQYRDDDHREAAPHFRDRDRQKFTMRGKKSASNLSFKFSANNCASIMPFWIVCLGQTARNWKTRGLFGIFYCTW